MGDDQANAAKRATPWHVWAVGVPALPWNSAGAFDDVMTRTRQASDMSQFTPEHLDCFQAFPAWVVGARAPSVWGGVPGSLLFLLRRRWVLPLFALSLAAMVPTFLHNDVPTNGLQLMGGVGGLVFTAASVVVGVPPWLYSRRLAGRALLP